MFLQPPHHVPPLPPDRSPAGTTWHTAGLVWRLRPSDTEIQLLAHTHQVLDCWLLQGLYWVQVMTGLEKETGVEPGWINNGGLFIANNKERLEEYKRMQTIGKVMGVDSYILSPAETKQVKLTKITSVLLCIHFVQLYPLMNVSDIYGTLYSPQDGTIDPHGLCTALSRSHCLLNTF